MKYKSNLINIQINNQLKPWNSYECIPSHQFSSPHRRRTTVWFFQSETGVKKQRTAPSRPNVILFRASNVTQKLPEVFGQITGLMPSEAKQPLARKPQWLFASMQSLPWTSHCALSWKLKQLCCAPCSRAMLAHGNTIKGPLRLLARCSNLYQQTSDIIPLAMKHLLLDVFRYSVGIYQ